jgi:L-threonylcarbamoyladenylate synthase
MKTRILPVSRDSILEACKILQQGDLVAFPTETVYGLGGLGLRSESIRKIFEAKGRPSTDPLILHLPSPDLTKAVESRLIGGPVSEFADILATRFWPGPLTMILPRGSAIPREVTAGLDTVAVRYPAHPATRELLTALQEPLAGPSANRFGRISPTDAQAVLEELEGKIPLILDGGECSTGIESTVISLAGTTPTILRPGAISATEIAQVIGCNVVTLNSSLNDKTPAISPGTLASHYAPQTPLYISNRPIEYFDPPYQYILFTSKNSTPLTHIRILTQEGKPEVAAQNLYRTLRESDSLGAPAILIDPIPNSPLAPALRDRITRASSGTAEWRNGGWIFTARTKN